MDFFVWQRTVVDEAGNVLPSASVSVTDVVSGGLAQLYSDEGVTGIGNPITADSNGFVQFFVKSGIYTVVATLGLDSRTWTKEAIGAPNKRTAAEISASVTPTNYQPHSLADVRRFGAVLDGVTDDTAAVARWLAVGAQGVALYHPGGTLLCSTWTEYVATSDIRIWSDAPNAVIKGTASLDFIRPAGGSIYLEGIEFNTWRQVIENDLADSGDTESLYVSRCRFISTASSAIDHERPLARAYFSNLYFESITQGAIVVGMNDDAEQDTWEHVELSNIVINDVSNTGTGSAFGYLIYGRDAQINNVNIGTITVENSPATAAGAYTKVRYLVENNITVEEVTSTGTATDLTAVTLKGAARGETGSGPQGFTSAVSNILVKHTKRLGFRIQNGGWTIAKNIVIEDTDVDGITLDEPDASHVVLDGFVVRTDTATGTVAVRVSSEGQSFKVLNGTIDGAAIGVRVDDPSAGTLAHVEIGNVHASNCGTGAISVNSANNIDGIDIHDLTCDAGCANGVIFTGAGTFSNVDVHDCDLSKATTKLNIGGTTFTSPKFRNIRGYKTRSHGVATVATGNTVAHGLVATPAVVLATPQATGVTDLCVSAIGATTFTLNFGGGGSPSIAWEAKTDRAEIGV